VTWNPLEQPQDFVILGGRRTPGIATLEGFSSPRIWDKRRGPGFTGATLRFKGLDLGKGTLRLTLITKEDWADWEAFAPVVTRPPIGRRATHLQIEHPQLEQLGIRAVAVEDVSQPMQVDETGKWEIEISLLEFRRPQPALSTPLGSQNEEPEDPLDRRIAQLTDELARESAR
jgi:hypothetical protein